MVEAIHHSPDKQLPQVEGEEGQKLFHTVSFYRSQRPNVTTTPYQKIVRNAAPMSAHNEADEDEEHKRKEKLQREIRKLQGEAEEERQRMEQASKALNFCVSQGEFEGSAERVEGERLLLEATHKYAAVMAEVKKLTTDGALGDKAPGKASKGSISFSGLALPLKPDFVRMLRETDDDAIHYFIMLIKNRSRVVATQMMSTDDKNIRRSGKVAFSNMINLRDLDYDFQISLEVYGLQTRKEYLSHDVKYHIKKDKSMFNLTPLKMLKKQDSSNMTPGGRRHQNPVNTKTIRKPAFGMVGYAIINIQTLKNRAFNLDKVPPMSPLDGGLEMTLTITSENRVEQTGFLTLFNDVNGYGDWCRRWCRLSGNSLYFWKYPEDEGKKEAVSERISLDRCVNETVELAPKEVCSRMNTLLLDTRRQYRQGDKNSLTVKTDVRRGETTLRHLLSADTRDERLGWGKVINEALDNIRAWDPAALRPRKDNSGSSIGSATTTSSGSTDIW